MTKAKLIMVKIRNMIILLWTISGSYGRHRLRASSPFGWVPRSHSRAAQEGRCECKACSLPTLFSHHTYRACWQATCNKIFYTHLTKRFNINFYISAKLANCLGDGAGWWGRGVVSSYWTLWHYILNVSSTQYLEKQISYLLPYT